MMRFLLSMVKKQVCFAVILCLILACSCVGAYAQNITVPYQMGFEDSEMTEFANWQINTGANAASCQDQWYRGSAIHGSGMKSLYITVDTGATAKFGTKPNIQYAYRDLQLPSGTYDITFDWLCVGSKSAALHVGYLTANNAGTLTALNANALSGTLPTAVSSAVRSNTANLRGEDTWQNASFSFKSTGKKIRLFFAWASNNKDTVSNQIGACIDNIQITSANCAKPANLKIEIPNCDSVKFSWTGMSAEYEVAYRLSTADRWHNVYDVVGQSVMMSNLSEGAYDFRVRGICSPDTSAWSYLTNQVVYCPEMHCVNFTDLHASNVVCTYGETDYDYGSGYYSGSQSYTVYKDSAYSHIGVIDFGSDSKQSRHTINWDKTAMDPRTGNDLPLIPKGGYASVRLGNWEYGNGAESVSYTYVMDDSKSVVLMQYAIVLEDPGHDPEDQPRFLLEVLDQNGQLLDATCGVREFYAQGAVNGWRSYNPTGSSYDKVVYKPWTTVGLNLQELNVQSGDQITIRLTTYDCFQGGHYGYAYFTLDCASATIEANSCAKDTTAKMTLTAPEGFSYQWYDKHGQPLAGQTTRIYEPQDTATYRCRLTSTEVATCYFDLYSQCIPRLPFPTFKVNYVPEDCKNRVELTNNSFVRIFQRSGMIDLVDEKCDEYLWETWGDNMKTPQTSDRENPVFTYPSKGGKYFVKLTAFLNGGCEEDTTVEIMIPEIQSYYQEFDTVLCEGGFIMWGDSVIYQSGVYPLYAKTFAGCDSTRIMTVTVHPTHSLQLDTVTICAEERYCIGGDCYRGSANGMFKRYLQNQYGCDSTLMQYVIVLDSILPTLIIDSIDLVAERYKGNIKVDGKGFSHYKMSYYDNKGQLHDSVYQIGTHHKDLGINLYFFEYYNEHDCVKFDTVNMGGNCLDISLESQNLCNGGKPVIEYPFNVLDGTLTKVAVEFSFEAKNAGWEDVPMHALTSSPVVIVPQAGIEPGEYNATLVFEDKVCGNHSYPITVTVHYPSSVLFYRWDDVISLKNATAAGNYTNYNFVEYQWYKDGAAIEGATQSYYNPANGLQMDGEYELKMRRQSDNQWVSTCPFVPNKSTAVDAAIAEVTVAPISLFVGQEISINTSVNGRVRIISATGQVVADRVVEKGTAMIKAPKTAGMYIVQVTTKNIQTIERISIY